MINQHYPPQQFTQYPPAGMPPARSSTQLPPPPMPLASIDPKQMPTVPLFTHPTGGESLPVYASRAALESGGASPPPPAASRYIAMDDGNASPDLLRATTYTIPEHRGVWHATGDLPLGVMCTPMAVPSADFVPRPRVGHPDPDQMSAQEDWRPLQTVPCLEACQATGNPPPPRCGHCHAYANPFFADTTGVCNLCNTRNRAWPADVGRLAYQYGTVEWAVDGAYLSHSTAPEQKDGDDSISLSVHYHLYAIDLTAPRLAEYITVLAALGQAVADHAARQTPPWQPRLGVCFVCSAGIYIRTKRTTKVQLRPASASSPVSSYLPAYAVATDVTQDPFCPLPLSEWTWDLSAPQGATEWQRMLSRIVTRHELDALYQIAKARNVYGHDGLMLSCGGAALQFLSHALESSGAGGRGTWITWRRPNYGAGTIPHRDEKTNGLRFTGTYSCATPLQVQRDLKEPEKEAAAFYQALGRSSVEHRVSLDVVYHTNPDSATPFLDLATMGELCRCTGGKLIWIRSTDWQETLREELSHAMQSFVGYDAVFKVRTSSGLQVKAYLASKGTPQDDGLVSSEEINLPFVSPSTCIAVQFEHAIGGIRKGQRAYVQTALLYTTPSGQRRVRVSTLALNSTTSVAQVFRSVDFGATAMFLARECVERLHSPKQDSGNVEKIRQTVRDGLYHMCVLVLASFRKNGDGGMGRLGQLILPEQMQLLPLFCMGLMKSPLLRPSLARRIGGMQTVTITPTADERAYAASCWYNSSVATAMLLACPLLLDAHVTEDGSSGSRIAWLPSESGPETMGTVNLPEPLDASVEVLKDYGVYLLDSFDSLYLVIGKDVPTELRYSFLDPKTEEGRRVQLLAWQLRSFSSTMQGCESSNAVRPHFPPLVPVLRSEDRQTFLEARVLDCMFHDAIGGGKDYKDFLVNLHRSISERVDAKS